MSRNSQKVPLPVDVSVFEDQIYGLDEYQKLGIILGAQVKEGWVEAELPEGWSVQKVGTFWSRLLDKENRERGSIYGLFGQNNSFMNLARRFDSCVTEEYVAPGKGILSLQFNDGYCYREKAKFVSEKYMAEHEADYFYADLFAGDMVSQMSADLCAAFPRCANPAAYWDDNLDDKIKNLENRWQEMSKNLHKSHAVLLAKMAP